MASPLRQHLCLQHAPRTTCTLPTCLPPLVCSRPAKAAAVCRFEMFPGSCRSFGWFPGSHQAGAERPCHCCPKPCRQWQVDWAPSMIPGLWLAFPALLRRVLRACAACMAVCAVSPCMPTPVRAWLGCTAETASVQCRHCGSAPSFIRTQGLGWGTASLACCTSGGDDAACIDAVAGVGLPVWMCGLCVCLVV